MGAVFKHEGDTVDLTLAATTAAGDVVAQGGLVGVAVRGGAAGALAAVRVKGVFAFPKTAAASGAGITSGATLYWNATGGVATTDEDDGETVPTAYPLLGKAVGDAASTDATVLVRLT